MNNFETVIGLEVHLQLKTESKVFCSCSTSFTGQANSNICPVCCGYPGVLPVFNQKVLELALRVCLALNCQINKDIYFERKNYFYPDLPKNYQISQYKMPLGQQGFLNLESKRKIKINRVHIEEDAGKLIHKQKHSLVDFNRTGIPLLEIVTEPEISSPQEAFNYLTTLKLILQYIGASDCDMEKGSLRCDANISLRKNRAKALGTKVELKNMNTFKGVRTALEFEEKRQARLLNESKTIIQETRLWDAQELKTITMRRKEEAHDYRYFPEPDLLDFKLTTKDIDCQKNLVGELPALKKQRFLRQYKIPEAELEVFIANRKLADFFESSVKAYPKDHEIANWLIGPFLELLNKLSRGFDSVKISSDNFAKIVKYFSEGKINNLAAKKALALSITTNEEIDQIIKREGLLQVSDQDQLKGSIEEVIKENPKPVSEYLTGKLAALQFLVGQVMKKTKGKANPKVVSDLLKAKLNKT